MHSNTTLRLILIMVTVAMLGAAPSAAWAQATRPASDRDATPPAPAVATGPAAEAPAGLLAGPVVDEDIHEGPGPAFGNSRRDRATGLRPGRWFELYRTLPLTAEQRAEARRAIRSFQRQRREIQSPADASENDAADSRARLRALAEQTQLTLWKLLTTEQQTHFRAAIAAERDRGRDRVQEGRMEEPSMESDLPDAPDAPDTPDVSGAADSGRAAAGPDGPDGLDEPGRRRLRFLRSRQGSDPH